ncbi:hypothetical protein Hanom_Chr09g00846651 [Helianthus anomalus]
MVRDQKKFNPDEPRSIHLIEDIVQDDIESLSIKLDIVRLEQLLENEKGLHPVQRFPFEKKKENEEKEVGPIPGKKADQTVQPSEKKADQKHVSKTVKHSPKATKVKKAKGCGESIRQST